MRPLSSSASPCAAVTLSGLIAVRRFPPLPKVVSSAPLGRSRIAPMTETESVLVALTETTIRPLPSSATSEADVEKFGAPKCSVTIPSPPPKESSRSPLGRKRSTNASKGCPDACVEPTTTIRPLPSTRMAEAVSWKADESIATPPVPNVSGVPSERKRATKRRLSDPPATRIRPFPSRVRAAPNEFVPTGCWTTPPEPKPASREPEGL